MAVHQKNHYSIYLALAVVIMIAYACRLGAQPATSEAPTTERPAAVTSSPVAPATQVPPTLPPTETLAPSDTPQPTTPEREGAWNGLTSQEMNFEINVKGNQVVFFNVWYQGQKGSCGFSGGFSDSVEAPIVGDQFTIDWKDSDGNEAHINGVFTSDSQASGTIDYIDNVKEVCDKTMHLSWRALSPAAIIAGTPIAPPATLPVAGLNGRWEGENSDGNQVLFDVSDEQITYISFNFSVNTGDCFVSGFVGETPDEPAMITDKSFSVELKGTNGRLFTFAGSFTSDTEASGTIHMKGVAEAACGAFDDEMTWTAEKSLTEELLSQPTETAGFPTRTRVMMDPVVAVQGFFDAYNAGDIDAALTFVADNVMFKAGSATTTMNKGDLKTFLIAQQQKGITYTLSGLSAVGDAIVKFSATLSDGTTYPVSQAMLSDGLIIMLTLK
jgi:hypothetical protein